MALLRKYIDKATFLLIMGLWASFSTYIMAKAMIPPDVQTLLVTAGSLIVSWIGVESGNVAAANGQQKQPPPPSS